MRREIFRWIIAIVSQSAKTWASSVKKGKEQEEFLSWFVYPLIGFITVAVLLGVLFTQKEFDLELALKSLIRTSVSSFGGFYLEAYLMNEMWQGILRREKDLKLWLCFVGYSSSLVFALNIILMLFLEFFFSWILILYTFYIIREGADPYMGVEEKIHLKLVGLTAAIILLIPTVIEILLSMLMPGLSFWQNNTRWRRGLVVTCR